MTKEDLTKYEEIDDSGLLTVTKNKVAFENISRTCVAYVYKDFGDGYFAGDFKIDITLKMTDITLSDYNEWFYPFALWNAVGAAKECEAAGADGLGIYIRTYAAGNWRIYLKERTDGATNSGYESRTAEDLHKTLYLRIGRKGTIFYMIIYHDATRTRVLCRRHLNLTAVRAFRYFYAFQSTKESFGPNTLDGYVENHEIQPSTYEYDLGYEEGTFTGIGLETTSPGHRNYASNRFVRGIQSMQCYTNIGGASGRVRSHASDIDWLGELIDFKEMYSRIYIYIEKWNGYINPLVFYCNTDTKYRLWVTLYPTQITLSQTMTGHSDSADHAFETGKWYCIEAGMKVHATEGFYKVWVDGVLVIDISDVDTSAAGDVGSQFKIGVVHYQVITPEAVCYIDCHKISESYIGPLPTLKTPERTQSPE